MDLSRLFVLTPIHLTQLSRTGPAPICVHHGRTDFSFRQEFANFRLFDWIK